MLTCFKHFSGQPETKPPLANSCSNGTTSSFFLDIVIFPALELSQWNDSRLDTKPLTVGCKGTGMDTAWTLLHLLQQAGRSGYRREKGLHLHWPQPERVVNLLQDKKQRYTCTPAPPGTSMPSPLRLLPAGAALSPLPYKVLRLLFPASRDRGQPPTNTHTSSSECRTPWEVTTR